MLKTKQRFVVDGSGKKRAVVLDMQEYRRLLDHVEKLEDALELDEAVRASESFRSYDEIRGELKRAGKL